MIVPAGHGQLPARLLRLSAAGGRIAAFRRGGNVRFGPSYLDPLRGGVTKVVYDGTELREKTGPTAGLPVWCL